MFREIKTGKCIIALIGSAILAFGIYNVHSSTYITEGGVLGLTLLFQYWWNVSPAISGAVLNIMCYTLGWKALGKNFLFYSLLSTLGFSTIYKICEQFPPLWPSLCEHPLLAAVIGAFFVGIGAGLCVRIGGAPGGDDALAMSLSKITKINIEWIYLLTDVIVLSLSVTYIPIGRMIFSLLSVVISGQIVGFIKKTV